MCGNTLDQMCFDHHFFLSDCRGTDSIIKSKIFFECLWPGKATPHVFTHKNKSYLKEGRKDLDRMINISEMASMTKYKMKSDNVLKF